MFEVVPPRPGVETTPIFHLDEIFPPNNPLEEEASAAAKDADAESLKGDNIDPEPARRRSRSLSPPPRNVQLYHLERVFDHFTTRFDQMEDRFQAERHSRENFLSEVDAQRQVNERRMFDKFQQCVDRMEQCSAEVNKVKDSIKVRPDRPTPRVLSMPRGTPISSTPFNPTNVSGSSADRFSSVTTNPTIVSEILQHLSDDKKKLTSGLNRTLATTSVVNFKWPQEFIVRASGATPTFDALLLPELIHGLAMMAKRADLSGDQDLANHMRHFCEEVTCDSCEIELPALRRSVRAVLLHIEQGIYAWSEYKALRDLREREITRAARDRSRPEGSAKGATLVCFPFQRGECSIQGASHQTARGRLHHVCHYCLTTAGSKYTHAESDCRRKKLAGEKKKEDDGKQN